MKYLFLTLLCFACAKLTPQRKITNSLKLVTISQDQKVLVKIKNIYNSLTTEDKEILTSGYLRYYRYAMKDVCSLPVDLNPGPGLKKLKIPPLVFLDVNRRRGTSAKQLYASYLDISTELGEERYYYIREADWVSEPLFNQAPSPEPENQSGFNLLLLKSGINENSKFVLCALHYTKKNLCVDDFITKQFTNINDPQQFCSWLKTTEGFEGEVLNETSLKLIQALEAIKVIDF